MSIFGICFTLYLTKKEVNESTVRGIHQLVFVLTFIPIINWSFKIVGVPR